MLVENIAYRGIWPQDDRKVFIIDQRVLPHRFETVELGTVEMFAEAISDMWVRGAPLIGATAAFGMYLAVKKANLSINFENSLEESYHLLKETRPTAVNLIHALDAQMSLQVEMTNKDDRETAAFELACAFTDKEVEDCRLIGVHGLELIREISEKKDGAVNILTHCNAGWLACVDWGTATAPIFHAFEAGIDIHVWIDETRPRNQGARLTAWEMEQQGIPYTVIADNASAYLMQTGQVDLCIVGTDRTTRCGDVANKIGTYSVALAANAHQVPFYVALPFTSVDWEIEDGLKEIPIEARSEDEVHYIYGSYKNQILPVKITPQNAKAFNPAFDITPKALVSGFITRNGVAEASEKGLKEIFKI